MAVGKRSRETDATGGESPSRSPEAGLKLHTVSICSVKKVKVTLGFLVILTLAVVLLSNITRVTGNGRLLPDAHGVAGIKQKTKNALATLSGFVNKVFGSGQDSKGNDTTEEGFEHSDAFRAFVREQADSDSINVLDYLASVRDYLLQFRSPMIREDPIEYSWPETEEERQERIRTESMISNGSRTTRSKDSRKLIVWYNAPSHFPRLNAQKMFGHCPVSNCLMSFSNKAANPGADAVIFLGGPGVPLTPRSHGRQVYIFFTMESPWLTAPGYGKTSWNSVFNWTWNYRTDSDIFEPVMYLKRSHSVPSHSQLREMMRQKTKPVAWMVSNCGVQSKRDQYVNRLKRIIPVDIYGRCGNLTCQSRGPKCDGMLNNYLFYLSFENSMCQDYVTEKYYKTFYEGIHVLSVVRGAANYSRFFPQGTFIDAESFASPEDLGRYLLELANDEARYVDLLWRRSHFMQLEHGLINSFCQVCYKLHHLDRYTKSYEDMFSWYHKDKCSKPRPFL